ncbi:hypothetical protein XENOCAPTIV_005791 [Xenoophorus captivus]|uniref:Uncharacterized protein n=1 Tax=Xenoophorus captivus TaxID=1517983 RepID=A0ABV0Q892_9TELE
MLEDDKDTQAPEAIVDVDVTTFTTISLADDSALETNLRKPEQILGVSFERFRPVGPSRCSQGGEPETEVGESGPRSVHREPHVGLQRLPDHRHQEQAEVRRCPTEAWIPRDTERGLEIPATFYPSQN